MESFGAATFLVSMFLVLQFVLCVHDISWTVTSFNCMHYSCETFCRTVDVPFSVGHIRELYSC